MVLMHKNETKSLSSTNTKKPQNFRPGTQEYEESQGHNLTCGNCGLQLAKKQYPVYGKRCQNVVNSTISANGAEAKKSA